MNITKEETIRALLDSENISSVAVKHAPLEHQPCPYLSVDFESSAFFEWANIKNQDIISFTPKYVGPEVFEVGDIVWLGSSIGTVEGFHDDKEALILSEGAIFDIHISDLIPIKKGELNND